MSAHQHEVVRPQLGRSRVARAWRAWLNALHVGTIGFVVACGNSVDHQSGDSTSWHTSTEDGGNGGAGGARECPVQPGACSGPDPTLVAACSAAEDHEAIVSEIVAAAIERYGETGALCGDTLTSIPATVPAGCTYVPTDEIFSQGDNTHGWLCLNFSLDYGIRYSYDFRTSAVGALGAHSAGLPDAPSLAGTWFEVSARADLDADGTMSTYAVVAYVQPDGSFATVEYAFQEGE